MWGSHTEEFLWLMAVNGFYRLTRGTYAQFGILLPYPEATIDTLLRHASDAEYFGDHAGNACNVLAVVHPLWLCLKQTDHRREEAELRIRTRLPVILDSWEDGHGFPFELANGKPSLQETEMWMATHIHDGGSAGSIGETFVPPPGSPSPAGERLLAGATLEPPAVARADRDPVESPHCTNFLEKQRSRAFSASQYERKTL